MYVTVYMSTSQRQYSWLDFGSARVNVGLNRELHGSLEPDIDACCRGVLWVAVMRHGPLETEIKVHSGHSGHQKTERVRGDGVECGGEEPEAQWTLGRGIKGSSGAGRFRIGGQARDTGSIGVGAGSG